MLDTIVGISSKGSISLVRLSGDKAFKIVSDIFRSKYGIEDRKISYGRIFDSEDEIDEVMVSFMKGPKSYTREDVVEIYCHGNNIITNKVIDLIVEKGARIAERGEFTKRAFINGRIDLTQAEAVLEILNSKSEKSIDNSLKNLNGFLRDEVRSMKRIILNSLANVNVVSDYPEEVEDSFSHRGDINSLLDRINVIIDSYSSGKIIKDGIKVAIVGRPNVGKSSIMNRLLKSDRAIVTEIEGTTRDIIEDSFKINEVPIVLLDTAGIRDTDDKVEKIGIDLSKKSIEEADLIIFVADGSDFSEKDQKILNSLKGKRYLVINNKRDIKGFSPKINGLNFSTILDDVSIIEREIEKKALNINPNSEVMIDNLRHKKLFERVRKSLTEFLESEAPLDIASIHLSAAIKHLSEIIGEISTEDLLDNIFSNFCVGK